MPDVGGKLAIKIFVRKYHNYVLLTISTVDRWFIIIKFVKHISFKTEEIVLISQSLFLFTLFFLFSLSFQVSEPMLAKTFHRKVQSKKIFTQRESFDTIIGKTEEKLAQVSGMQAPFSCHFRPKLFHFMWAENSRAAARRRLWSIIYIVWRCWMSSPFGMRTWCTQVWQKLTFRFLLVVRSVAFCSMRKQFREQLSWRSRRPGRWYPLIIMVNFVGVCWAVDVGAVAVATNITLFVFFWNFIQRATPNIGSQFPFKCFYFFCLFIPQLSSMR